MPRPAKKVKPLPKVWMRVTRTGMPLLSTAAWRKSAVGWMHDFPEVARFEIVAAPSPNPRRRP